MRLTCKLAYCFGIIIFFICGCAASLPTKPSADKRVILAVIPASNNEVDQKLSQMITTALKKDGYFVLVERNRIKKVFDEQRFQYSGLGDYKTLVEVGQILNARYIAVVGISGLERVRSTTSVSIGVVTATIYARIMDVRQAQLVALVSSKGRSFSGGLAFDVIFQNKRKKDLIGVQRTTDDIDNASIRSAVDNIAADIVNAIYNEKKQFIVSEVLPSKEIEKWSKSNSDNRRASALARLYLAPYDLVWEAITKYFEGDLMTVDSKRGIIITKYFSSGMDQRQVYVYIERDTPNSTKVTVKGFCYYYEDPCPQHRIWMDWIKFKGICWKIYPNPTMCSNVYIKRLTSAIEERLVKGRQ